MADSHSPLETARLRLRPFTLADLDDLAALFGDPEVMRFISQGKPRTREESAAALQLLVEHWPQHGYGVWALHERDSGRFVGRCGLRFLDDIGEIELLYTLHREFWGKGYATEAARASLEFGIGKSRLERIIAFAMPENLASQRVMEKVGMRLEKTVPYKDVPAVWYAITRAEQSPLAKPTAEAMTFMMGKFPAELPGELLYATRNHMWSRQVEGRQRFGFTSYAVRLMQDVYFLDWSVSPGDSVHLLQQVGHIETSKAVADLFAPLEGKIVAFNQELLKDPSAINVDKYGAGWLFEMEGDTRDLLPVAGYHQYLADNWDNTQRLIKGKINTED